MKRIVAFLLAVFLLFGIYSESLFAHAEEKDVLISRSVEEY